MIRDYRSKAERTGDRERGYALSETGNPLPPDVEWYHTWFGLGSTCCRCDSILWHDKWCAHSRRWREAVGLKYAGKRDVFTTLHGRVK